MLVKETILKMEKIQKLEEELASLKEELSRLKNDRQKFDEVRRYYHEDILENIDINTVFIATPHNTHAAYTLQALKSNKNVFVEKPLAMDMAELEAIREQYESSSSSLMVGFNRRFSPIARQIRNEFEYNSKACRSKNTVAICKLYFNICLLSKPVFYLFGT